MIKILWSISICFLLACGIYFSVKLKFPQVRVIKLIKSLVEVNKEDSNTALKSVTMSLAARIGVGSLAGISLSIYYGGPGTIFWIWVIGILTSINTFCESYLGVKYQEKKNDGYCGGPSYYIKNGLKSKNLSKVYAIIVIITYIIGFISVQSNTISVSINNKYGISKNIIGIVLLVITFLSIYKGIKRIGIITSYLIPLMSLIYILISTYIIINNSSVLYFVFKTIIYDAFKLKSFGAGFLTTFIIGVQRGIFSTESGLGTSSIAISTTKPKSKIDYSIIQILGIYFTVFVVCTSTALIILSSDYTGSGIIVKNGIELTNYALNYHMGNIGSTVLIVLVIFLAYSTIVAGYYYGESNVLFLKDSKFLKQILKIFTCVLVYLGCIFKPTFLWNLVDILIGILSIINTYSIFKLKKEIEYDYNNKNVV